MLIRRPKGRGAPKPGILPSPAHHDWHKVVCVASGPSFSIDQALFLREHARPRGWRVMVTNTSWERLPDADLLHGGDGSWWRMNYPKVKGYFKGECWTIDRGFAHRFNLHYIRHSAEKGLSRVPNVVFTGGNSGHVIVNQAFLFGARQILLVGYDFQDSYGMSHWHGDHPQPLNQNRPFAHWLEYMDSMAPELQAEGVDVINCTIQSAIQCFPRGELEQWLR